MYTMDELRQDAELAATGVDLNWEKLEDPFEAAVLVSALERGVKMLPDLESIYTKLTSGKSVLTPDQDTPLGYDDLEKYTELIAEELHAAYVLAAVKDKYDKVNNIIALSGSL
jgi:hypothetical protein